MKWERIAHILRKNETSITKTAIYWTPEGKQKRGRPKTTWRCILEEELQPYHLCWSIIRGKAAIGRLDSVAMSRCLPLRAPALWGWLTDLIDHLFSVQVDFVLRRVDFVLCCGLVSLFKMWFLFSKLIPRCIFYLTHLDHYGSNLYQQDHRPCCLLIQ